jgi:hypothetical protein
MLNSLYENTSIPTRIISLIGTKPLNIAIDENS